MVEQPAAGGGGGRRRGGGARARWLLAPPLFGAALWLLLELQRPDLLLVGNVTVDVVEGTTPTGGAVSYAAAAAKALGARACVVTVAGPEADLGVFTDLDPAGSGLFVLPANTTLTFEHSYAWWGHARRLRVTANPNVTVTRGHVPWRCRLARVVLLGPLTLHDLDAASFAAPLHPSFPTTTSSSSSSRSSSGLSAWLARLLNLDQQVGLLGQGLQRALGPDGDVTPLPGPSPQLLAGLGSRVSLFLSDVETETWSPEDLARVVAAARRVVITHGEQGAELLEAAPQGSSSSRDSSFVRTLIPAVQVPRAVDTNGAGDTFATLFMLALLRGDADPGATAAWAASRAVLQPQTCKPRCAADLVAAAPDGLPRIGQAERLLLAVRPLLRRAAAAAGGGGALQRIVPLPQHQQQAVYNWCVAQLQQVVYGRGRSGPGCASSGQAGTAAAD